MVDCSEGSQLENIYCGCVYCTLKVLGQIKATLGGMGLGMFGQNMKIVFVGQK